MINNYPFGVGAFYPAYDPHADYQTNSKSYLDELARTKAIFTELQKQLEVLYAREIETEDTNTVKLTKIGEWLHEMIENPSLEQTIKLQADVLLSLLTTDGQLNSLEPKPKLYELSNAIKKHTDGLYVADLAQMIKDLDNYVQTLIERVDTADPVGAQVLSEGIDQYANDLPTQRNQDEVVAGLVKDKDNIINLTLVTDIHLRTFFNGYSSKEYFNSVAKIHEVSRQTDAVFFMGDNIDGLNGQATDNSQMIHSDNVRYANEQAYRKVMNLLIANEPNDTFALIGNHDRGGLPFLRESNKHFAEMIPSAKLAEISGTAPYGVYKIPNKKLAVIWLNTMDSENYQDFVDFDSVISDTQLAWLQQQLDVLEPNYHVLIIGHHNWSETTMKNGVKFKAIMEEFEARENSNYIGYFHGHQHMDKVYPKGDLMTSLVVSLRNCFPDNAGDVGTATQSGFYVMTIDTDAKTCKLNNIGHTKLTNTFNYGGTA